MDEIIQILIFVGAMVIMVIQQNVKSKKKPETAPAPDGEMPEILFEERKRAPDQPSPVKPQKKPVSRKKQIHSPAQSNVSASVPSPSASSAPRIRLNDREEARRAFIYSEIFKRKY